MSSVCQDQETFNKAIKTAVKNIDQEECTTAYCKSSTIVMSLILLVLYIYGILLALRVQDKNQRLVHIIFALVFGPVYTLAYYINEFSS